MAAEKLTEYECRRLENIRRNDEMITALKIHAKASLLSAATKRRRTSEKKEKKPETTIAVRRSIRTRRLPRFARSLKPLSGVQGPLSFEAAYRTGSDRKFIDTILDIAQTKWKRAEVENGEDTPLLRNELGRCTRSSGRLSSVAKNKTSDSSCDSAKMDLLGCRVKHEKSEFGNVLELGSLTLEPKNVKRSMPRSISVVKFLPCANVKIVAVGNKLGHVGFWNFDKEDEEENGILLYRPHIHPVSSLLFEQSSLSKVITSCYGGLIRLMDAEKLVFDLVYSSKDPIFSLSQRPNDGNSLYFGEGYGGFNIWDLRAGKSSFHWELHENRINSVDFNPQNHHVMATSSSDWTACLWDLRRMSATKPKTLKTVNHEKTVHSAHFSPSGLSLATTKYFSILFRQLAIYFSLLRVVSAWLICSV